MCKVSTISYLNTCKKSHDNKKREDTSALPRYVNVDHLCCGLYPHHHLPPHQNAATFTTTDALTVMCYPESAKQIAVNVVGTHVILPLHPQIPLVTSGMILVHINTTWTLACRHWGQTLGRDTFFSEGLPAIIPELLML